MKSSNKNIFAVLFVTIFIGGNLFPITAQSVPINISDVNVWIEIEEVFGPNSPLLQGYQNTSSVIWKDFHIRIPNTQDFGGFISLQRQFAQNGLSPDQKTWSFWDGSIAQNDTVDIAFILNPGGKVKYQVQATTSGSHLPVPLPGALPLFVSGLILALRQVKASKAMARSSP